jgi:hypothetical protein
MAHAERAYEDLSGDKKPEGSARSVVYHIFDAATFDIALDAVENDSALTEGPLVRNSFNSLARLNDTTWSASVSYVPFIGGLPDPTAFPGRTGSFQFETGGGRRTVLKNISTRQVTSRSVYAVPYTEAELGPFINANEDGIEGVEIEASVFKFSVSKAFSPAELSPSYVIKLRDFTNCYNSTPVTLSVDGIIMPFAVGELLFLNASGGRDDGDGLWKFTYSFASQKNLPAGTVIGDLTPFTSDVLGWSYLEIRTFGTTEGDPPIPVRKPRAAIEHVVYNSADLNQLGI